MLNKLSKETKGNHRFFDEKGTRPLGEYEYILFEEISMTTLSLKFNIYKNYVRITKLSTWKKFQFNRRKRYEPLK